MTDPTPAAGPPSCRRVPTRWWGLGPETLAYPRGPLPPPEGPPRVPAHDALRCDGGGACERACPTDAIRLTLGPSGGPGELALDYGRCVQCGACVDACPTGAMAATSRIELATTDRADLQMVHRFGAGPAPAPSPLGPVVRTLIQERFQGSLAVRVVDAGSCNGCEVEVQALTWPTYDLERLGIHLVASPRHADALLVTGPVTRAMRHALAQTWVSMPEPRMVLAVGACGISGGPFRNSGEVLGGAASVVPVDVFVPGCPPRPEALLYGFWVALAKAEPRLRRGEYRGA